MQGCASTHSGNTSSSAATEPDDSDKFKVTIPESYAGADGLGNSVAIQWSEFFDDPYLAMIIDAALENNQELNILMQEIEISRNEIGARQGEYLPFANLYAGAGIGKVGQYTTRGAVEENLPMKDGEPFPDPVPDFGLGMDFSWEIDIWNKLRSAKKAAVLRYLATEEGRNFMVTRLVAEISEAYYELLALDNSLTTLERMLDIQKRALTVVGLQKTAGRASSLAVRRFEAEVFKNQSELYEMQQLIIETENRINFLVGRFPQHIERSAEDLETRKLRSVSMGKPSDLLINRPDVRQAEFELEAAKLDINVARARFYPTLELSAAMGFSTSDGGTLLTTPESLLYNLAGELVMPLFNKKAIRAAYNNASAIQLQALFHYQKTVLNAYVEVLNQYSMISNIGKSHESKAQQVEVLSQSISIANSLYRSARADYTEVLLTQRDALESNMELIELRLQQFTALVNMYQALGGGYDRESDSES